MTQNSASGPPSASLEELREVFSDPALAELDLGDDFDPDKMMEELKAQEQRLNDAQERLEASQFTMQSGDGMFEVTVKGGATITQLDIHPEALRKFSAAQLGPEIVGLIGEAMAHAATVVRDAFSEVFDAVEGLDASQDS